MNRQFNFLFLQQGIFEPIMIPFLYIIFASILIKRFIMHNSFYSFSFLLYSTHVIKFPQYAQHSFHQSVRCYLKLKQLDLQVTPKHIQKLMAKHKRPLIETISVFRKCKTPFVHRMLNYVHWARDAKFSQEETQWANSDRFQTRKIIFRCKIIQSLFYDLHKDNSFLLKTSNKPRSSYCR